MGWFQAFRGRHGFSWYGDLRSPVTFDMPLAAVTYLAVLVAIATLISTLGIRGRHRWASSTRAALGVAIGSIILVCLYGSAWLTGEVEVESHYIYRSSRLVSGTVGLNVGLQAANITLDGTFGGSPVYYSEQIPWPDFGSETRTLGEFLERGVPEPVLRVADYLSTDAGGLRWPRSFHMAGHFAQALLWTAFAFWIVTNILLFSVVCYGAYICALTGLCLVLSSVVYHVCQPPVPLVVPFESHVLSLHYGWCFWLTLVAGILTLCGGLLLIILDHLSSKAVANFFGLEVELTTDPSVKDPLAIRSSLEKLPLRRGSIFSERSTKPQEWFLNRAFTLGETLERTKSNPIFREEPDIAEADESVFLKNTEAEERASTSGSMSTDHGEGRDNDINERNVCALPPPVTLPPPPVTLPPHVVRVQVGVHEFSRQSSQDSGHEQSFMESVLEHVAEQRADTVIDVGDGADADVKSDVKGKDAGDVKVNVEGKVEGKAKAEGQVGSSKAASTMPGVEERGRFDFQSSSTGGRN